MDIFSFFLNSIFFLQNEKYNFYILGQKKVCSAEPSERVRDRLDMKITVINFLDSPYFRKRVLRGRSNVRNRLVGP